MRWVGIVLVSASTVWLLVSMARSATVLNTKTTREVDRRVMRRLLRAVGLWEFTIAGFLVLLQGWSALPNCIALVATGVLVMVYPRLFGF